MQYIGEIISLSVAVMWTVTALVSEVGTKRIGVVNFNTWRLLVAMLVGFVFIFLLTGKLGIPYAGIETWLWMALSGFVGFYFGDYCLFKSYMYISSRYSQIFMTLAPAAAAVAAWLALGQTLTWGNVVAMGVTLLGIGITVLSKEEGKKKIKLNLPWKGIVFGIGAGLGQGLGLVISKIGMQHYEADIPSDMLADMENVIPFSANVIRCIAGFSCFFITVLLRGKDKPFLYTIADKTARRMVLIAVLFGPFLGVGLSLMAVQYAKVGIAQTLMALTPILIIWPTWWLFKQPITIKGVVGAVISVIGAALFFLI